MTLVALPLNPFKLSDNAASTVLDGMASLPVFPMPTNGKDERRVFIASVLSDPHNRAWLVWREGSLCGILLLTDIVPQVDALCHFAFFDRTLFGRKTLIWKMMGQVFREFGLQRLSVELPEHLTPLIKFCRNKLYFRCEGEQAANAHPLIVEKVSPYVANAGSWAARLGSRREKAFWREDTQEWVDLIRLRLLREEYEAIGG